MQPPTSPTSNRGWALFGAASATFLFAGTFLLFGLAPTSPALSIVGALAHVVLFPLVAALRAHPGAKAAGYGWLTVDIVSNIMTLNGGDAQLASTIRLGGHVAAAVWIIGATVGTGRLRVLGYALGAWLGAYSFAAPWVPEAAFYPAFILLLAWMGALTATIWLSRPTPTAKATDPGATARE